MLTGIDHVVVAVPDLAAAGAALEREAGLTVSDGGRHAQLGTQNRLVWFADSYLELLAVFDRRLAATSWIGAPTLRRLDDGGGFVAVALASSDLEADLALLRARGSVLRGPLPGERVRPDGGVVRWRLALPPELDARDPVFLIEHDPQGAEWDDAARRERAQQTHPAGGTVRLSRVELALPDPQATLRRLRHDLGLAFRPSLAGGGARDASIGSQVLRVRGASRAARTHADSLPAAAVALRLAGGEGRSMNLAGVRLIFEAG